MLRFVSTAVLLALTILGGVVVLEKWGLPVPSFRNEILVFFLLSNLAFYWFTTRHLQGHPQDFLKIYLGATVLRILFFGAFCFALMTLDRSSMRENTAFFLICYFLFTAQEVVALYSKVNSKKAGKSDQK